jgi:SH3 domain protein
MGNHIDLILGGVDMKLPVKIGTLILFGLVLVVTTSAAETKYVVEDLTIPLRTGPGLDRKIIAFPSSGQALEVIAPGDEYTEVTTPSGKQGFVLTRYLTEKEPASQVLARLEQKHTQLMAKYEELLQKSSQLSGDSKGLSEDLAKTQKNLEQLTTEHESLKNESKQFLQLKAKHEKAVKEATEANTRADKVEKELQQLYSSEITTGILYGGGLIVLGFITGFIVKRPRRRSPLM